MPFSASFWRACQIGVSFLPYSELAPSASPSIALRVATLALVMKTSKPKDPFFLATNFLVEHSLGHTLELLIWFHSTVSHCFVLFLGKILS